MRVALFNGPDTPITIERVADPRVGADELLIRIHRCGVCGSDLSMTSGSAFDYPIGCRLGHEYAGEIIETGKAVIGFRVGDRVTCMPQAGCGTCAPCRLGRPIFCRQCTFLTGGFADFIAIPARSAVLMPQSLSFADAALVEPMACGLRALRLAGMRGGERVMVLGAGSMAIALIYWARVLGAASVLAVSRSAHRRDTLMALGADAVHGFDEDDPSAATRALGGPPDIVAECIGTPGMLGKAIEHAATGGAVICMGMCMQPEPVTPALCAFKEIRLYFPVAYSMDEFVETAAAFDKGRLNPELMISDVIGLDDLPGMFESLRAGVKTLKVQVDLTLESADA